MENFLKRLPLWRSSKNEPERKARLIAHYLPQYHPIPENDEWWGKGFTEWTNVTKAKPLFEGHYQPILPSDLGFYDLRVPEVREAQADLARYYGIESFCYWHYWFNGRQILQRPFSEVLKSGKPDFPFCLGWANDSWSGIWHGDPSKILIEQTYPGKKDEESHFYSLLEAFFDKRYTKVDDKPLFLIYKPYNIPKIKSFLDHWRNLAIKEGLSGIYFIGNGRNKEWKYEEDGFDGMTPHNPGYSIYHIFYPDSRVTELILAGITKESNLNSRHGRFFPGPEIMLYEDYIKLGFDTLRKEFDEFPCILPNWDNTARSGNKGWVLLNSSPELFQLYLERAIEFLGNKPYEKKIIFIKSWNEWAEGNILEPDMKFGKSYLESCKKAVIK